MARVRLPLLNAKAAKLPPVCIICGAPVDLHIARTFTYRPAWASVVSIVSIFVCLPVALILLTLNLMQMRRATVECPVCYRHRGYWAWRGFLTLAPLAVLAATVVTLAVLMLTRVIPMEILGYVCIGTVIVLALLAIYAGILRGTGVRCDEITDNDIVLVAVSDVFADLLRFERRRKKDAPDYGWEDYDPYPRQPTARPR